MANRAVWLDGPGQEPRVDSAPTSEPGEGELLIRVKAVPVQPGEWKIQAGLIPVPLRYPTVIGVSLAGVVEKIGTGVRRFRQGDRVVANSASVLRDDHRFGAYQKFCLATQDMTAKIGETISFEEAGSLAVAYSPAGALFLHLGLDRPQYPALPKKHERVLIWGVSSSFGAIASQLAARAGYDVVGVAAGWHAQSVSSFGVDRFVDRTASDVVQQLISLGPFKAVLSAADDAADQVKIGQILGALGGGYFLTTFGVRDGVEFPPGVTGGFGMFLQEIMDPKNVEFKEWLWWDYLEKALSNNDLESLPVEVVGGLSQAKTAWDTLRKGGVSGKRQIITPDSD
ncbi:Trans-enoyl reductase himH-like protein [Cladobotryum mycophilum]|uniref:Trans-enoyl reductase himH-like protein n=1 Tax=Cladobotryum mycophilum TaxID=491253 RepID=A0ABR0SIW4_9HYPO